MSSKKILIVEPDAGVARYPEAMLPLLRNSMVSDMA